MRLFEGVTRSNILGLFLFRFVLNLNLYFMDTFVSQLLVTNFGLTTNEAGHLAGTLGFYSDILLVCTELLLGYLMDTFGRKGLSLIGYLIAGCSLVIMPYVKTIYPGALICRMLLAWGLLPSLSTPLHVDYVTSQS